MSALPQYSGPLRNISTNASGVWRMGSSGCKVRNTSRKPFGSSSSNLRTGGGAWLKACRRWTSRYYQSISWHSIFAGMGVCPDAGSLRAPTPQESRVDMAELEDCLARCALNFDRHQEFLARQ